MALRLSLIGLPLFCSLCFIVSGYYDKPVQRFDGWFNNPMNPDWGGAGRPLERNCTPHYRDETYAMSGWDRPNPRLLSSELFGQYAGVSGLANKHNRTALFAFFGKIVQRELVHTDDPTCPIELVNTRVPKGDPTFDPEASGEKSMPYERLAYDKTSGQSPNNPRRQINKASSFIDASFLYGTSAVRVSFLQESHTGKLGCEDRWGRFPKRNDIRLPYHSLAVQHNRSEDLWRLGDEHVYESPPVLALTLMLYRYHNRLAEAVIEAEPDLSPDLVFERTRRKLIGTLQKVIVYDWLPKLIMKDLPPYTGYKPWVKSAATDLFDAGAINYIMTLIPPAIYQVDMNCKVRMHGEFKARRLCNTYWKAMDVVFAQNKGAVEILRGLAVQLAERDDTYVIEDIRNKFYGPLYHSNHDLVMLTIMKGRDYGLPDYNTVRETVGLPRVSSFEEINPWLNDTNPQLMSKLKSLHMGDVDKMDMFVGGMMETTEDGPGPLFTSILYDQFIRIRDGDRFWFENKDTGLLTEKEIAEINSTSLADIMVATEEIKREQIQEDVFTAAEDPQCGMRMQFTEDDLDHCPQHTGYDFFQGSEVAYIIIWTCFGLLPLLVIFAAYLLAKCKKWRHEKQMQALKVEKEKRRILRRTLSSSVSVHDATEWRGSLGSRPIELHLTTKGTLEMFTGQGPHVRTIKLCDMDTVNVKISSNKRRTSLALIIPREYDVVVEFATELERSAFEAALCGFCTSYNSSVSVIELRLEDLQAAAITKEKRNQMLEKFFKTVFSEAFKMDYNPSLDSSTLDLKKHRQEIMEIELTREEFAEAMAVKADSDFVEHFFNLIDSDRNGYISFREFLNAVILFSTGGIQEKLQMMFYMYDIEGSGYMSTKQLGQMFGSLLELAQSTTSAESTTEMLVKSLCEQAGMEPKELFSFEDFAQILSPQMGILWNTSFDWKGVSKVVSDKSITKAMNSANSSPEKGSRHRTSQTPSVSNGSTTSSLEGDSAGPSVTRVFEAVRETYTPLKARVKSAKHFVENYRQHIFFLILFYGLCVGLFAERFYYYTVEQEDKGFRKLMSYGISMTRGAAASMSFTFSLLLLTMCRNTITYLRSTPLNLFIPFDSTVSFHKVVAWTALFFSAIHIVGYSFNFYHLVTQPTRYLCIFTSLVFRDEHPYTFQEWLFGTLTGFTGVLLTLVLCVLYVFATQTARRHIFNLFWLTHKLFIILYVLTLIHGASMVVQKPLFYAYFIGPAVLFMADKLISLSRKKTELCIMRAQNLPSDVTFLEFKRPPRFEYKSGQWVRIACLGQGKDEYHPFTLTSAPHEDTLKLHIRALGPWTWTLRHTFDRDKDPKAYPKLYLDGPYGAGQQDWYQYDVSVLVGAGIGVTPYASILKDFVHMTSINMKFRVKCQKVYFIWITGSQRHFEWLLDIIREVEEVDTKGVVSTDIFITQFFQNFDLRTSLLYVFEEHFQKQNNGKSVFTGLKATTHFGRPQMHKIMAAVHKAHPQVRKVGVFSCGPQGVTKGVERACKDTSKTTKAMFEHHYENF